MRANIIQLIYLISTALFIFSLHWMNSPKTARKSVLAGVVAMFMAIVGTMLFPGLVNWGWIAVAIAFGFAVGIPLSRVPLTAVPQRTALSHAFGGLAAGLVGTAKFYLWLGEARAAAPGEPIELTTFRVVAIIVEIILGYLTFTGSLMAAGKLQEVKWIPQRPVTYKFQNQSNFAMFGLALVMGLLIVIDPVKFAYLFPVIIVLSLAFGVLLIIPIGGADMPTVIALLNSYAGLVGRGDGLRARQQAADHRRRPRRLLRPDPLDHHVQGDEPLVRQRAVRRVRAGAGRARATARANGGQERDGRRRGADHGAAPVSWSSSPATAWRSPRPSTGSRELYDAAHQARAST